MKKIFIVIGSLGIGGTEKQLLMKMNYLKDKYDFTIILFFQKGELYDSFKKLGIKVVDFSCRFRGVWSSPLTFADLPRSILQ